MSTSTQCVSGSQTQELFNLRRTCAIPGDVILITKPLGLGVARKLRDWYSDDQSGRERLMSAPKELHELFSAIEFANYIEKDVTNEPVLRLLSKYNVHAITEVSEAGILGDAEKMAKIQVKPVHLIIQNLPIIGNMHTVPEILGREEPSLQIVKGRSPEVGGGMLVVMSREDAVSFCLEIHRETKFPAWIIGTVMCGNRNASLIDDPLVMNVSGR